MAQLTRSQSKHELLYCEDEALMAFSDTLMSLPIHGYSRMRLAWPCHYLQTWENIVLWQILSAGRKIDKVLIMGRREESLPQGKKKGYVITKWTEWKWQIHLCKTKYIGSLSLEIHSLSLTANEKSTHLSFGKWTRSFGLKVSEKSNNNFKNIWLPFEADMTILCNRLNSVHQTHATVFSLTL